MKSFSDYFNKEIKSSENIKLNEAKSSRESIDKWFYKASDDINSSILKVENSKPVYSRSPYSFMIQNYLTLIKLKRLVEEVHGPNGTEPDEEEYKLCLEIIKDKEKYIAENNPKDWYNYYKNLVDSTDKIFKKYNIKF